MPKKCPKCGSRKVIKTEKGIYCKKCHFINSREKQAKIVQFIFLFFLILFSLSFIKADIISINWYGNEIYGLPSQSIEGFGFAEIEEIIGIGGGGTGINPKIYTLNSTICKVTYSHLILYGNESSKINLLQETLKKEYNITENWAVLRMDYVNPFQELCGVLLNLSLRPEFLCNKIYDLMSEKEKITLGDVLKFKEDIKKDLDVPFSTLIFYFNNFDLRCRDYVKRPLAIVKEKEFKYWWIIIILVGMVILFFIFDYSLNKKRLILKIFKRD